MNGRKHSIFHMNCNLENRLLPLKRAQNMCWGKRRRNSPGPGTEVCQGKREHRRLGPGAKSRCFPEPRRSPGPHGREAGSRPWSRRPETATPRGRQRRPVPSPLLLLLHAFPRNPNQQRHTSLPPLLPGLTRSSSSASVPPPKPSARAPQPELKGRATQGNPEPADGAGWAGLPDRGSRAVARLGR